MARAFLPLLLLHAAAAAAAAVEPPCDVIVAGGSLASFAAAVTAANASSAPSVCFLDPTDWPGGQLTASGVPAVDFGPLNGRHDGANIARAFAAWLWGPSMPGAANLGSCWVSLKCFPAPVAVAGLIQPLLAAQPNLRVYTMTTVAGVSRDAAGRVTALSAVRRTPAPGTSGWEALLSEAVEDWYSPAPSARFSKEALTLPVSPNGLVIEATEFGDVLATGAGLPLAQGIEAPLESSPATQTYCGQAITIPFSVLYSAAPAPSPDPVPAGSAEGEPWGSQGLSWTRVWTYRRSVSVANTSIDDVRVGDISCQNVGGGNDDSNGYPFLPTDSAEFIHQATTPGAWRGGLNLTALAMAEQRSFGYYHHFVTSPNASKGAVGHLSMAPEQMGTASGLAKMPYLRDARRSAAGLGGYRLTYSDLAKADPQNASFAQRWPDTIALGTYFYADIHKMTAAACPLPPYLTNASGSDIRPYFIPFRALTVEGAPNLLVAGKSMAQTFWASAGTRLHPEEFNTGVSAGAAASWMFAEKIASTADALARVAELQALLASDKIGQPLWWTA